MRIRDMRNGRKLSISELASSLNFDEKRLKILERGFEQPSEHEITALTTFFKSNDQLSFPFIDFSHQMSEQNIGEGYVTALNNKFKIHEPLIASKQNKIKILDLFCGIGGLSYGFEQTGKFTTIAGVDLLEDRINSFQLNHKHAFGFSYDINTLKPAKLKSYLAESPDIIVGGAPCQGFSSVRPFRSLTENDKRNNLYQTFASYLHFFKPKWFVFENVVGLLTHKNGETLKTLIGEFKSLGYSVDFKVLNAAYYGLPQLRERLILVGNNIKQSFIWPKATHFYEFKSMAGQGNPHVLKPLGLSDCIPAVPILDALSDLPALESGQSSSNYSYEGVLTDFQKYLREGSKILTWHSATVHSQSMLDIIEKSGYNINAVKHLVSSGFSSSYSRLEPNKPSVTLTVNFVNPSSNKCIHPLQNRALTPREGARIQGFPDKFGFNGTRTQIVKQIGNAVPPILSKVLADYLFKYY